MTNTFPTDLLLTKDFPTNTLHTNNLLIQDLLTNTLPTPQDIKPKANQMSLLIFDFADLSPHIPELRSVLSAEEQTRADQFYTKDLQSQYCIARGLLRMLIGEIQGVDPKAIVFEYNAYGKPFLKKEMAEGGLVSWPPVLRFPTLHFNLSHSHQKVVYAFSYDALVGVDVEYRKPIKDRDSMAKMICTEGEYLFLEALGAKGKEAGEMGAGEVEIGEMGVGEVGAGEMEIGEVGVGEVEVGNLWAKDLGTREIEVETKEIETKGPEAGEKDDFFYTLWTGKEAFIKAIGMGLSYPLTEVEIVTDGKINSCLCVRDLGANGLCDSGLHPFDLCSSDLCSSDLCSSDLCVSRLLCATPPHTTLCDNVTRIPCTTESMAVVVDANGSIRGGVFSLSYYDGVPGYQIALAVQGEGGGVRVLLGGLCVEKT